VGEHRSLGLFIAGDGRERSRLASLAASLGVEAHVRFLGARADARALMGSADAYVQASAYEGYGLALVEAALAPLPIVTTDVGVVGEVFAKGRDVIAVPVARPDLLAEGVARVVEDDELCRCLARSAEAAARAHLASEGSLPLRIARDLAHDSTQLFRGSVPGTL
jgi:glycosyltransferase involved in cell wall biosynthesis